MKTFKSKKADIPVIKTIVILLITTTIFISFVIMLMQTTGLTIEDKKLQTQIIQNKIFNSNCFSNEFGIIEEKKFTQDSFEECFKNLPPNIAFKTQITGKEEIAINSQIYTDKISFCSIPNSNVLCTNMKYPITLKTETGKLEAKMLLIQTIVN